ncbi:MAG: 23S rRNA (adenine(2030)-N(6))-methyltransferase RlmJ [Alphaproteobacteria bacterium]|nr:23S rRNA (adenine(2030)-N(6))-methyltransferase RlmJ [Alphaproteobacteria bacterium]
MAEQRAPYDHRFHAGNHADVWKHVAWLSLLAAHKRERILVLDTHAGRGGYALPARGGEWTMGIGRLRQRFAGGSTGSGAVDRYLARMPDPAFYAGSPLLTRNALGRTDQLVACEHDEATAEELRRAVADDPRIRVRREDGWAAPFPAEAGARTLVLCDPPFHEPADWLRMAELGQRVHEAGAVGMLWYPIKRWTRPTSLHHALRGRKVPHVAVDLLVTPIERTGHSLAGSGVVLIGAPASVLVELHAALPVVGQALAHHEGRWSSRSEAYVP